MARVRKQTVSGLGMLPEPQPIVVEKDAEKQAKITGQHLSTLFGTLLGLVKAFNGYISLGDGEQSSWAGNLDAQYKQFLTPSTPDTEFTVFHELGRLPIGYEVVRRDRACIVYDSSSGSWGEDKVFLKCDTASATIKLRIY